jgi:uncharacterized membrane protein YkvA (DUF1232 family)
MAIRSNWLSRPNTMRSMFEQLKLAMRLLRDPRVPMALKIIPGLGAAYILSPIDIIPDFFPAIGQLDDLAVMVFALEFFIRLCPSPAQLHHREAIAQGREYSPTPADNVIEAHWTRH